MFIEDRQKKLFKEVKEYFEKNKSDQLHEIDHIIRVIYWTKFLSEKEEANLSITIPAAILHDVAIPKHGDETHAKMGADMCKPFLKKYDYDNKEIEIISKVILAHSTDDPNQSKTMTLEEKILFDADKLDAAGPVAYYRWILEYIPKKDILQHEAANKILEHLQRWRKKYGEQIFFTETARKIGKERIKYIENRCKDVLEDLKKFKEAYKLLD